ncbi:MAG: hypothetical protein JXB23_13730 [Candidatus Aminicenantes bacterium]|nr:hypothetical protein [Candidatus Aminicenantes bacterium]
MLSITEFKLGDPRRLPKEEMMKAARRIGFQVLAVYGGFFCHTVGFSK